MLFVYQQVHKYKCWQQSKRQSTSIMSFFIRFDVFIVVSLTLILGSVVKKIFKKNSNNTWADKLFPYALVYLPLALIYAFIANEMPLTGFSINPIYDTDDSPTLGPQSISGEAIVALTIIITSIILNLIVWLYSMYIVVRYYVKRNRQNHTNIST